MLDSRIAADTQREPALAEKWDTLVPLLQREAGDNNFRSWLQPVSPLSFSGAVLTLAAPTQFTRDWVRKNYADLIRRLWTQHFGPVARIDVVVEKAEPRAVPALAPVPQAPANDMALSLPGADVLSSPLDPRHGFDGFVTGPSNSLAASALRKLAESEVSPFNPLYVHGAVGMGKTHLLQAAAAAIRARRPAARIVYMSAERFMYLFVKSLRARDTMAFKAAMRDIDVLLFDDLQFICGKENTQDEFLSAFNALLDEGKQVVVASDRSPVDLDGIGERLRSRLGGGLVARIDAPDLALRLEILRVKRALLKRDIPDAVLSFLAENVTASVRELEGAFNRLIAHAELEGRAVTVEAAASLLQDILQRGLRRATVEDIQKKVAGHYGLRVSDLLSPRRARPLARPRQVAMYLAKALTAHSLPDIGRKFGGRDHTTIIHGVRRIEALMLEDAGLAQDVDALKRAIAG